MYNLQFIILYFLAKMFFYFLFLLLNFQINTSEISGFDRIKTMEFATADLYDANEGKVQIAQEPVFLSFRLTKEFLRTNLYYKML